MLGFVGGWDFDVVVVGVGVLILMGGAGLGWFGWWVVWTAHVLGYGFLGCLE